MFRLAQMQQVNDPVNVRSVASWCSCFDYQRLAFVFSVAKLHDS